MTDRQHGCTGINAIHELQHDLIQLGCQSILLTSRRPLCCKAKWTDERHQEYGEQYAPSSLVAPSSNATNWT